jgi:hypothetical protein
MKIKSKIQSTFQVELFDNAAYECNQILHIRPHQDNAENWSEFAIQDIDPGHFDRNSKPCSKIIFDNVNLDSIIKALILYKDNLKIINN